MKYLRMHFTLIELLVVIAIIGVLASMLLPALNKAKQRAHSISCLGNQKQMSAGISMYANDYQGWLPVMLWDFFYVEWRKDINTYVGMDDRPLSYSSDYYSTGVFRCSSFDEKLAGGKKSYGGGYGWNYVYMGRADNDASKPRVKLNSIAQPSASALCGDSLDYLDNPATEYYMAACMLSHRFGRIDWLANRHLGGMNVVWGDGHCSWMSQKAMWDGENGDNEYYYT